MFIYICLMTLSISASAFNIDLYTSMNRLEKLKINAAGLVQQCLRSNEIAAKEDRDRIYKTRYAHLDTIRVKNGARVKKGAKIGTVGDTGFTIKVGKDASHLHFEVCQRGKKVNPLNFLS